MQHGAPPDFIILVLVRSKGAGFADDRNDAGDHESSEGDKTRQAVVDNWL
jgi:hypothetical protein